jgi:pumilio family protein 6
MSSSSVKRKSSDGGRKEGRHHHHRHKKAKTTTTTAPQPPQQQQRHTTTNNNGSSRKRHQRRHAETVEEAKRLWNQLRVRGNTGERTRQLMDQLMPLIAGKARQIALQHDASRVVQAALQFGGAAERRRILAELCRKPDGDDPTQARCSFVELCKSQYAHFAVLKAVKYCHADADCANTIVRGLRGHVAVMAVHAVASRVVESVFTTFPAKETAVLKQEFYGPHFALFAATDTVGSGRMPTLETNLKAAPDKKDATIDFVRNLVNKGLEKQLNGFTYFQELLAEYMDYIASATDGSSKIRDMANTAADHAIHLLSSRSGTRVVCHLVTYGTAKHRKRVLKSVKGYAVSGLLHRDAYLALIRLCQCTDDTVSVQKNLLHELIAPVPTSSSDPDKHRQKEQEEEETPLLQLALSDTASKLLLLLLMDTQNDARRKKVLDPYERSILLGSATVIEDGEEVPASKKDPEKRRTELLQYLKEPLINMCAEHADELLRSIPGSSVLREVYAAFRPAKVVEAVLDACEKSISSAGDAAAAEGEEEEGEESCIFEHATGHLAIKHLFLVDANKEQVSEDACFARQFVSRFHGRLMEAANSNRGAFVVAALCKVSAVRDNVLKDLDKDQLKKMSNQKKGHTAGFTALFQEVSLG